MREEETKKAKVTSYTDAPASVTYTIRTKNGFNALFSVREESGVELLKKMALIEQTFLNDGVTPQPERSYGGKPKEEPKTVIGKTCPTCGNPVVEVKTKLGKTFYRCSTQKYDFSTKTITGCPWTDWNVPQP